MFAEFTPHFSKMAGKTSLRFLLMVPFMLLLFMAVGLTGYLSLRNGQKAVNDVTSRLRDEITARIQLKLSSYLQTPHLINQITVNALHLGMLSMENIPILEKDFWEKMQVFDAVGYIYMGSEQGGMVGVGRNKDGSLIIEATDNFAAGDYKTYSTDAKGGRKEFLKASPDFDARRRPWYTTPVKAGKPVWGEVFAYFAEKTLAIPATKPYYDAEGKLQGVLSVDLQLYQVSDFLQKIKIGKSGRTFIIERNSGLLIGSSTEEKPFVIDKTGKEINRLHATDSTVPLIRETALHLQKSFKEFTNINNSLQLSFDLDHKQQFLQVTPLQDEFGLDWLIVVVVPEADFMEHINANTRMTILLSFFALVFSLLVSVHIADLIVRPVLGLKDAAVELANGKFDQRVEVEEKSAEEISVLGHAFNKMAKQLEEMFTTLEEKNAELRRLDKLKDDFLANTSHELRTPLHGIIGISESLIDGAAGDPTHEQKKNLSMIATSGHRLANLVNDILDFSKLKHNTLELQLKAVWLREITEIVLMLSKPLVGNKKLTLINSISADLPPAYADENRVQQILHNLVGNGIKFSDAGSVDVSAVAVGEMIEISVKDTGIGIPSDKFERLFESFEQLDGSTARKYGGTGLGLAVSKKLVDLHKGQIRVQSKVGMGSTFTFTLPLATPEIIEASRLSTSVADRPQRLVDNEATSEVELLSDEPLVVSINPNKATFNVLIADDERVNRQILVNQLAPQNYAIFQAADGLEALALVEKGLRPDIVLLDVMMPHMTGYEVCRKLRETYPAHELPVLLLTAKNQIADLVSGLESGANDYLTKPVSKNELLTRIKTHIHLSKINIAYGRFVPREFLHFLEKESIVDVKLGDQVQREMSVLFSDIRDFTTLSEKMTPEDNFRFINAYLSRMEPLIIKHQGFIDKYIGDAIMALFAGSADDALQAGIAMLYGLVEYNQHRIKEGYKPIGIGIGINTGSLMLGTVGGPNRMDGTVISDAVNLASRIEGLTKNYGAALLISHQTFNRLQNPEAYAIRKIDQVKVKGKTQPVTVYEVFEADPPEYKAAKLATKDSFTQALAAHEQGNFIHAVELFKECTERAPFDKVAHIYLERCQKALQEASLVKVV